MPSTNQTELLGLHQWTGNERAKRQDFVDDNKKIDDKFIELNSQLADIAINPKTLGAKTMEEDPDFDSSDFLQLAFDKASLTGERVIIPSGRYKITKTLYISEGTYIEGVASQALFYETFKGVVIMYYGTGVALQIGRDSENSSNISIKNLYIRDANNTGSVGMRIGGSTKFTHNISLEHFITQSFDTGFLFERVYGVTTNLVVSRLARQYGYHFTPQSGALTLSTFTSTGACSTGKDPMGIAIDGAEGIGFFIERDITYSSFNQCYTDHAKIGIKMTGYTGNRNLFNRFGIERVSDYGVYIDNSNIMVGFNALQIIDPEPTIIDNVYFSGVHITIENTRMDEAYKPSNGYDIRVDSGYAIFINSNISSVLGEYVGSYRFDVPEINNNPQSISYFLVDVPAGTGPYIVGTRRRHSLMVKDEHNRGLHLGSGIKGQELIIYGVDDEKKAKLGVTENPKLPFTMYLGKGDFAQFIYDDLDGSGNAWHLLNYKLDRRGSIPTTGFWERGRIFWSDNPLADGAVGYVNTENGSPGVWKKFGTFL